MREKILITGASGYVGSKIYQYFKSKKFDIVGLYHKTKLFDDLVQVDITNNDELENIIKKEKPDVILHLAADAHTKTCEDDPKNAQALNVDATKYIAEIAKKNNIRVIYLSTFSCYNKPTSVYSRTKLEAENIIKTLEKYVIIRASLIVGVSPNRKSHNFFNDVLEVLKNGEKMEADSSWEFEMTCLDHLSEVVTKIVQNDKINECIIPVVAKGVTSRYKIAKDILGNENVTEIDQNRVIPLPELDEGAFENFDLPVTSYKKCIDRIIQELR